MKISKNIIFIAVIATAFPYFAIQSKQKTCNTPITMGTCQSRSSNPTYYDDIDNMSTVSFLIKKINRNKMRLAVGITIGGMIVVPWCIIFYLLKNMPGFRV